MNKTTTPGPWHFLDEEPWFIYQETNGEWSHIAIMRDGLLEGDMKANARLIAAAPDLYAELENIANVQPGPWEDPSEFRAWAQNRARNALAKAAGGKK